MICPNCNSFVEDGNAFCTTCGQTLQAQGNYQGMQYDQGQQHPYRQPQQDPYAQQTNGYQQQNPYGQPQQDPYAQQNPYGQPQQNAYMPQGGQMNGYPAPPSGGKIPAYTTAPDGRQVGMNWFKFIIYVQLFLSAIVGLYNGIQLLTGSHYQGYKDMVYSMFDGLKGADTVFGLCFLVLAGFAIFTRFQLAGFKTMGPRFYLGYLAGVVGITIIYIIVVGGILSKYGAGVSDILTPSTVANIVTSIVLIFVNFIYFKNRKHLFVN